MRLNSCLLVLCTGLLTACVTTTDGQAGRGPAQPEEAARINRDLGVSYLRQGDLEQAEIKLLKSIQEAPDNADSHRALGMVYTRMGDDKGAEKEFREAVKLAPNDANALNQLGAFLCARGKTKEAMKYFDKGIAVPRFPDRYQIKTNAGTCIKNDDIVRSEAYLRGALADNPNYYEALYQMADVAYRRESYLQARAFIERRLGAAPSNAATFWLAYQIEVAMGDTRAAENYSGLILDKYPESVEAGLLLEAQRDAG